MSGSIGFKFLSLLELGRAYFQIETQKIKLLIYCKIREGYILAGRYSAGFYLCKIQGMEQIRYRKV